MYEHIRIFSLRQDVGMLAHECAYCRCRVSSFRLKSKSPEIRAPNGIEFTSRNSSLGIVPV